MLPGLTEKITSLSLSEYGIRSLSTPPVTSGRLLSLGEGFYLLLFDKKVLDVIKGPFLYSLWGLLC